jgi:bifunctional non-homologous end joining protein LigD
MPIEFCLPTSGKAVPSGPDWLHEIKYDGYRLRVERHGDQVKLTSRGGLDWTRRCPWIAETARKIRQRQFIIDGEAVVLGVDGISDFDALHSRKHDHEVQLYAFDCLAYDGDDLSRLPLHLRQDEFGSTPARASRGDLRRVLRAGRDRSRAVRGSVPDGA